MKNIIRLTVAAALLTLGSMAQAGLVTIFYENASNDCGSGKPYESDDKCSIFVLAPIMGEDKSGAPIVTGWAPADGAEPISNIIGKNEKEGSVVDNGYDADPWNFDWDNIDYSDLSGSDPWTSNSGTWTYDYDGASPIRFWVAKTSTGFYLNFYSGGLSDDDTVAACSDGSPLGNNADCLNSAISAYSGSWSLTKELSHLSFYNGEHTTVPEPGTLALLGLGLLGLGAARRRKVAGRRKRPE